MCVCVCVCKVSGSVPGYANVVLLSSVGVVVELRVLRPPSMKPGQSLLALLQEDLPAQDSSA